MKKVRLLLTVLAISVSSLTIPILAQDTMLVADEEMKVVKVIQLSEDDLYRNENGEVTIKLSDDFEGWLNENEAVEFQFTNKTLFGTHKYVHIDITENSSNTSFKATLLAQNNGGEIDTKSKSGGDGDFYVQCGEAQQNLKLFVKNTGSRAYVAFDVYSSNSK